MTTSDERQRNLIWGRDFLEEFTTDDTLAPAIRAEAVELLRAYPSLERLESCPLDELEGLQLTFYAVLAGARDLFQRVQASPSSTPERPYSMTVVLRHFMAA